MPGTHTQLIFNGIVRRHPVSCVDCQTWLGDLVPKIHMTALCPPVAVRCDHQGNEGVTGFVVISTSHAAFHYWEPHSHSPNRLSFCLYSCRNFDPSIVIDHLDAFWSLQESRYRIFDRSWDITDAYLPTDEVMAPGV